MNLAEIFTEEVCQEFDKQFSKYKDKKHLVLSKSVLEALEDALQQIRVGAIKTDEDLEDYIEELYGESPDYMLICAMVQYVDGEFGEPNEQASVIEMFEDFANFDEQMSDEELEEFLQEDEDF